MRLSHFLQVNLRTKFGLLIAASQIATLAPAPAQAATEPPLLATVTAPTPSPAPMVAVPAQPKWLARQLQIEKVAYAIGTANADRCDRPIMATGLVMHDIGSYNADTRATIAQCFGLGMGFGILGVVPGSGADHAGLHAGDEIVGVDGVDLQKFGTDAITALGQHDRMTRLTGLFDTKLRQGSVQLQVRSADGVRNATLAGLPACGGRTAYVANGPINAWSDGDNIAVTEAMLEFVHNDDELAFVMAHEFAHNLLHHDMQPNRIPTWLSMFGIGSAGIKRDEVAADEYAVDLLDRTHYNARGAIPMVRRTAPLVFLDFGMTHPGVGRRIDIIETRTAYFANQRRAFDALFDLTRLASGSPLQAIPQGFGSSALLPGVAPTL